MKVPHAAVAAIIIAAFYVIVAHAQHDHHSPFHINYQSWVNGNGQGCCNQQHCSTIPDSDLRSSSPGGVLELLVRGVGKAKGQSAWCPVLPFHYLSKGNAPDWSSAHACITDFYGSETPCGQFICYQPKPAG